MTPDAGTVGTGSADSHEVLAAVDETDGEPRLVIADIVRDDAWLSVSEGDAAVLEEWA